MGNWTHFDDLHTFQFLNGLPLMSFVIAVYSECETYIFVKMIKILGLKSIIGRICGATNVLTRNFVKQATGIMVSIFLKYIFY